MVGELGEHVEEMISLFKQNEVPLRPSDISMAVLDIACAQGLVTDDEFDLAHDQLAKEIGAYYLRPEEVVA